ncbi:MAG: hypothetical protein EPN46_04245 [Candidimonas sp.]|nr:MAG: hypothetical protein EPN77_03245 [Candidimonas sp.]TAM21190.1 MAG: hypothetical protein EPN62_14945 [Candidimonas sp.]TAM79067.1 MAG: hypothetical protein EPN46_04245 [Candidimonas sp.]
MHSLTPGYLAALRFDGTQAATLRSLGEYQGKQQRYAVQSPEALKGLRQIAVVESTESSNRLEGVIVAPSRLRSLVIRNAAPKNRSEQEIAGYRDALALIHESAAHMPFNEGVVLQLHTMLYRYMPPAGGRWKATNNDIIERHPDGTSRPRFQPVTAHLTPMAMADLTRYYATALDQSLADPLVLVPLAMLDYFWGALLRAYREFEERVGTVERGRGSKGDRVRTKVLGCTLPFSISEIEEACPGVSRDMVRLVLRGMKSEGLIESTGKGRGAKWIKQA